MKIVLLICACMSALSLFSQGFIRQLDIPVTEEGRILSNPWSGGLNYVQYSKIDLDGDDQEDLFVFDRSVNKVLPFINEATEAEEINYKYAPEFESIFPEELKDWVLLRDYNCDGLKDIFTSGSGGIKLFRHEVIGGEVSFVEVYADALIPLIPAEYDFGVPFTAPVYNSGVDLPHIGDIDDDGDIDILSFSDNSIGVNLFINTASEIGRCDTLIMELGNACYGFFMESFENSTLFLDHSCEMNVLNPRSSSSRDALHAGGTLLSLETNGDGYPELVIGDSTVDSLALLINAASVQGPDSIVMQFSDFPASISTSEAVSFYEFPAVFHEDFNNDGLLDIAASSFSTFNSIDDFGSWLYLNEGDNDFPRFVLQNKDWLQNDMIEHGTRAMPVIFDYDSDGLGDLILAHERTITNATTTASRLRLYRNTGTEENPEFELMDENWLNLEELMLRNIYPAFGDLDNDGDMDMLLGENTGTVHYFENSAGAGVPVSLSLTEAAIQDTFGENLDPGQDVIPQLLDLDEDGLIDLLLGEVSGNVNFYKNVGTAESFAFELINEQLGGVQADNPLGIHGNSIPHFYKNSENVFELIMGNELGRLQKWKNISGNLSGEFTLVSSAVDMINDGDFSSPFLYDIDNDGFLDLFLGNERGGVTYYKGQFIDDITEIGSPITPAVNLFPNPTLDKLNVQFKKGEEPKTLNVFNVLGELVLTKSMTSPIVELNLGSQPSGIYLIVGEFEFGNLNVGNVIVE